MPYLPTRRAVAVFTVLASAYLLSALVRGVTGTLAPVLTQDFGLSAAQLGLLAGGYFLGFACMQLPLGQWLDRYGPQKVQLWLLSLAVLGCLAFALADGFATLLLARVLSGIGLCACLMAPLTGYRRWLGPDLQMRANAWMLMVGALGLLLATLPVQWALPLVGWRAIFGLLALLLVATMLAIAWQLPRWEAAAPHAKVSLRASYQPIFRHPHFRRMLPLGLVGYGGLVAVQTLWAGPWMTQVAGYTPLQAASGLFGINLTMLVVFWLWGSVSPLLERRGLQAVRLMLWGLPLGILALAAIAWMGPAAGWPAFAVFCALSSFLALSQPSIGLAFPVHEAGRAMSAFNLLIFLGTFVCQWSMGLGIDALVAWQLPRPLAFQIVLGVLAGCSALAYLWFALTGRPVAVAK